MKDFALQFLLGGSKGKQMGEAAARVMWQAAEES
jgi:hypothetical protein